MLPGFETYMGFDYDLQEAEMDLQQWSTYSCGSY